MLMRERDRERKRMKRMDPEYRKLEQERDRDRKKARRANEAFRQLEKMRDKLRKDRKKRLVVEDPMATEYATLPAVSLEPEVIISDATNAQNNQTQNVLTQNNNQNVQSTTVTTHTTTNSTTTSSQTSTPANVPTSTATPPTAPVMSTINKGVLYAPHTFTHHPLPLSGVALMPQLCHPILHQNISASLYPPNGIKQEYNENQRVANGANNEQEREYGIIEADFVMPDGMPGPHHFHNHPHAHHLHQPHTGMFQHMATSQAHIPPHMRLIPTQTHGPLPPPTNQQQQAQQQTPAQHVQQQQQQQQQMAQHYEQRKPV